MSGKKRANPKVEKPPAAAKTASADLKRRILILAPTANDARLTLNFLINANLPAQACGDVARLCHEFGQGCGAIILAEETLGQSSISVLVQTLAGQPAWSDIPIILITSGGEVGQTRLRRLSVFGPGGNVTLLERPFRPATLISAVEVALRSRQRQYEAHESVLELKRAHDETKKASRAKDDFLAALSHELRTPLNPALLIASESADNHELPEPVRLNFEIIRKNIELEARLIDDLLDLTRITTGKIILNKDLMDVHDILRDAIATTQPEQQEKKLHWDIKLDAVQSLVEGDAVRLQQVFWNVLKNAVKFTPVNGKITLETFIKENGRLLIKITDTGIGMNAAEIARVFTAFAQGDHAGDGGSHRFGGLGLGLAISKNLIELHSGKITARSTGKDKGSVFTIELPLAGERKTRPKTENGHANQSSSEILKEAPGLMPILLVEDHETTRTVLAQLLTRRNYKVVAVDSMVKAREAATQNKFGLLISDIGLPDGNGNDLMNEFREKYDLKGIALTGYGMEEDIAHGKAAGFVTHLIKPVRIESLENALALVKA